ncbi:hypothetical protein J1N35_018618 [Gossypium stocksii]|uniref:Uncharacterized protein n=1 Tax=Gossypium stocksii TaxID=47602 RepID=A0A9D4A7E2_9ROSI|nr:hypothetical protein J1N35_018618 [Gossypium stocksii]
MIERSINIGELFSKRFKTCKEEAKKCLLSIIDYFTLLEGPSYITRYDLERLLENVGLLNQVEPNEPKKLEYDESSTKFELKANLTNGAEEAETEEEPNSLELRVDLNAAELMEPSFNPALTIQCHLLQTL